MTLTPAFRHQRRESLKKSIGSCTLSMMELKFNKIALRKIATDKNRFYIVIEK